jgi:hypothetical protein
VFTGQAISDLKTDVTKASDSLPNWIEEERAFDVFVLKVGLEIVFLQKLDC